MKKENKIKWTRKYKTGYILRREVFEGGFEMTSAYNYNGDYIGTSKEAHFLCAKKGILPELSSPDHEVCSIGY